MCILFFFSSDGQSVLFECEVQQSPDQHQALQLLSIEPILDTKSGNVETFESEVESHTIEQTTSSFECEIGLKTKQQSMLQPQKENEIPQTYITEQQQ